MAFAEPGDGVRIYYEMHGPHAGRAVLLIGTAGADHHTWDAQLPALAARYRTIVFDPRFAGRTTAPDEPFTLADLANDALAVLVAAEVEQAAVVGASMGGCVAQELALAAPRRVWALALAGTTAGGTLATVSHAQRFAQAKRLQALPRGERGVAFARAFFGPRAVDANPEAFAAVIAQAGWDDDPAPGLDPDSHPQNRAIATFDASGRVGSITAPTLVLHGDDDIIIPPQDGRNLARAIPSAQFRLLRGGHLFFRQYPATFNEAVLAFLAEQQGSRAAPNG